jgi:hypothetical protein
VSNTNMFMRQSIPIVPYFTIPRCTKATKYLYTMPSNPNDAVTRADLNQQLEVHAKTVELQILLSKQQEEILKKLDECVRDHTNIKRSLDLLERRTWKQGWLFWGMIFSLISTSTALISQVNN